MISDNDIKKLKSVFATKEDLDESEARTAVGFTDVQRQLNTLKVSVSSLEKGQEELKAGQVELKEDVKEIQQQLYGMEHNIIRAINSQKDETEILKKRVTKLEKLTLSN